MKQSNLYVCVCVGKLMFDTKKKCQNPNVGFSLGFKIQTQIPPIV